MRYVRLLSLCLLLVLSCYDVSPPFDPTPPTENAAVSLTTGNQFCYECTVFKGGNHQEWYSNRCVTGDTFIGSRQYAVVDSSVFWRSDPQGLYDYYEGAESTLLQFDVSQGDTITFWRHTVIVDKILAEPVFNQMRLVVHVSNAAFSPDTIVTGAYAHTFGVLRYYENVGTDIDGYRLTGARVDSVEYGEIFRGSH